MHKKMSLMTENLLLEAQTLRLEGEMDSSIALLRIVLSQCNSDLQLMEDEALCGSNEDDECRIETTQKLREMASYQLALLLLQRSGRWEQTQSNNTDERDGIGAEGKSSNDENEADDLLWKLGYRLRLSNRAFGYPICIRQHRQKETAKSLDSKLPLVVVDQALPSTIFDRLQHAFRPESLYWSEFYSKVNNLDANIESIAQQQDNDTSAKCTSKEKQTKQFASHNIPLSSNNLVPSRSLSNHLQHSKSLFEQVAIIAQHRLKEYFPEVMNATSVEVWSHSRPPDGQHQLHYDMDEVLLFKHRKGSSLSANDDNGDSNLDLATVDERSMSKRQKTSHCAEDHEAEAQNSDQKQCNDHTQRSQDIGVSCPIVSCVLTIQVPDACQGNPTIVCNQSITRRNGNETNSGYLCYPRPNRLLAFDGSLLHGVVPGIPLPSSEDESESSSTGDVYGTDVQKAKTKQLIGNDQRITLMMGFWKEVCLTIPDATSEGKVGPNVPYQSQKSSAWAKEFQPISIGDDTVSDTAASSDELVNIVDPLWVPVCESGSEQAFGKYSPSRRNATQFYGRFFLRSLQTTDIDHEVLSGSK